MNIDISIEQELKEKIARGDEKAFGRLFDNYVFILSIGCCTCCLS